MVMPKFNTWKIWLARNRALFLEVLTSPEQVANKCLGLMMEHFNQRRKKTIVQQQLTQEEEKWFQNFLQTQSRLSTNLQRISLHNTSKSQWKLHIAS
jgi:hypothetical protein